VSDPYADVEAFVEDVGYKPNTPITEGINKFVDWYLAYINDFNIETMSN
jgi:UDP-glucuronate 4-epimerase